MKSLSLKLKLYLSFIYVFTFVSIIYFINNTHINFSSLNAFSIIFFSALIGFTESSPVVLNESYFSTSFAVIFASYILKGPETAMIVSIIGYSISYTRSDGRAKHIFNLPFYKTLFNYCLYIIPIIYGDCFFKRLGGMYGGANLIKYIFPMAIFSIMYFIVNVILVSVLISYISGRNIYYYILTNMKLLALNYLAMTPFGIIAVYLCNISWLGLVLFMFPIFLVRFTFLLYIESKSKYIQTVDVIMNAIEARDKYTEGHSKRVAELAVKIAKELKYSAVQLEDLSIASLMHDVGKIGINDYILNKPGKLSPEEYEIIKKHPEIGFKILSDIEGMENVKAVVKYHHERYDGKGYPEGKNANELNLDIFIVQLADSVDAMTTDRPYRKALDEKEIVSEVKKHCGTQFHPEVVEAYFKILKKESEG